MTDQLGPVTIGAREIYDLGLATKQSVERVAMQIDGHAQKLADHEVRLDAIEQTRWPLSPAAVVAGVLALISILLQILPKLVH